MGDPVYISRVRIERVKGSLRRAWLPAREEPVEFGVHDEVADHYGVPRRADMERSMTLDYLVASAAG